MRAPDTRSPPRVLHFVTHLRLGGAETVALMLGESMAGGVLAIRGWSDDGIGLAMRERWTAGGGTCFAGSHFPYKAGGMLLAGWAATQAVRRFAPDLIHLHTEIPESTYATMVTLRPSLRAIPVMRTIHNSEFWHHWSRLGAWCERRLSQARVVAVSQAAAGAFQRHRRRAGVGSPDDPSPHVIYNGIEADAPAPTAAVTANRDRGAESAGPRLLFAGRLEREKGADLLPAILTAVVQAGGPRGHLTIQGEGQLRSQLAALAAKPPAGWVVTLRPPEPGLRASLGQYDLVLMPSRHEGLSLLAVETLLAGVPLIATDAPGLAESLPDDYPWRARVNDAAGFAAVMVRALGRRPEWPAIGERGREFARTRFDRDRMVEAYRALYREVLDRAGK